MGQHPKHVTPKPVTNPHKLKKSIHTVKLQREVRLLLWGGAYKMSDNYTFQNAANAVYKDYFGRDHGKYSFSGPQEIKRKGRDFVISTINSMPLNSIHSLDMFTHGGPEDIYMVSARDTDKDLSLGEKYNKYYRYWDDNKSIQLFDPFSANFTDQLGKIDYDKFANDAKIEFHGCATAGSAWDDIEVHDLNIASVFSKLLYDAGKTESVVIGHTDHDNPTIDPNNPKITDYRHGIRKFYNNGYLIGHTKAPGMVDEAELVELARTPHSYWHKLSNSSGT